ncbi:hypothetical protein POX_a00308 [Penicillium oxalicum]|uniref:hypothetical protein n=1 Tax=Penicillium oxalicum TaxID=69781 RepID=UPI0020B82526|nr:hypothetical protein POX_a00308 [Penicillium oxalicum]KAI2793724.1 hypothetical protein POX_a00308 [Penicillium oxalicum]
MDSDTMKESPRRLDIMKDEQMNPEAAPRLSRKRARADSVLQPVSDDDLNKGSVPTEDRRGNPPIWANTRQQVVDAIDWYRSMQGGVAHSNKRCTGFLVDGDNGGRSVMTDEAIITRVGGGSTKDGEGNLSLKKDQSPDGVIITAVMTSMQEHQPVGVVIGSNNKLLNIKIPHRYCVLDWFIITDVWSERIGKFAGYRLRLEKLDWSTKGWWTGSDTQKSLQPGNVHEGSVPNPPVRTCGECGLPSKQIYAEPGWMCLQPTCSQFWKIGGKEPSPAAPFVYHPGFLNNRLSTHLDSHDPGALAQIFDRNLEPSLGSADREEWKGIVCPHCHKCIQRITWDAWDCSNDPARGPNETCSYRVERKIREIPLDSLVRGVKPYLPKQLECTIAPAIDRLTYAPYETRIYEIPGGGWITHFVANDQINGRPSGPNDLFDRLQKLDLGLRRYPLTNSQVPGTLTCHFAVNYGVPYKYVVSVNSKAFSEAPTEILTALGRLSWATEQAVKRSGGEYQPPNELLALGYFEQMKIGFHDDGEKILDPRLRPCRLGPGPGCSSA